MAETDWTVKTPIAEPPLGTVYVHLCSGEVREITDVQEIAMTDAQVIFTRGDREAVIIDRRDVYYACCEPGDAPSAY
jgi:hypothetical protein